MNSESHLPVLWFCVSYLPFLLLGLLICKVGRGHQVSQSCDSQWDDKGFSVCQERIPKDVGFFFAVLEESPVTDLNCPLVQRTSAEVPVYTVGRQVDHWVGEGWGHFQVADHGGKWAAAVYETGILGISNVKSRLWGNCFSHSMGPKELSVNSKYKD